MHGIKKLPEEVYSNELVRALHYEKLQIVLVPDKRYVSGGARRAVPYGCESVTCHVQPVILFAKSGVHSSSAWVTRKHRAVYQIQYPGEKPFWYHVLWSPIHREVNWEENVAAEHILRIGILQSIGSDTAEGAVRLLA